MQYQMEELIPIVAKLAKHCTSKESTSITYQKAQQLMDAVLYCLQEAEQFERAEASDEYARKEKNCPYWDADEENRFYRNVGERQRTNRISSDADENAGRKRATWDRGELFEKNPDAEDEQARQEKQPGSIPVKHQKITIESRYEFGASCVREKTQKALQKYNQLTPVFRDYKNRCLYDTVVKGLPEFFRWYDCKFEPQNTILTLDYPVLTDLSGESGIDKIYDYILCLRLEQTFMNRFPEDFILEILAKYSKDAGSLIENLCEIVLTNLLSHILIGKNLMELRMEEKDYQLLQTQINKENDLEKTLRGIVHQLIWDYYNKDGNLEKYLDEAVPNISVRLKNAARNKSLYHII